MRPVVGFGEFNPALQPDPRGPAFNTYQYATSDPINNTDTTGLQISQVESCIGGVIVFGGALAGIIVTERTASILFTVTGVGGAFTLVGSCSALAE